MRENNTVTPRSVEKEGEEVHQNQDSSAGCGEDHGEAGCSPAAHGSTGNAEIHPQAIGEVLMLEQVNSWRRL